MIPNAPDGTALDSYVNALRYLSGVKKYLFSRNCIVWRAKKVSEILDGKMSSFQVLMRFTILPLVLETLHKSSQMEISARISSNDADVELAALLMDLTKKFLSQYKRCPRCLTEDLLNHGVSFGRTLHQFAAICVCPNHDVLLEEVCLACGAGFEVLPRFAPFRGELQVCYRCKKKSERPLPYACSEGYMAFANLLARGLKSCADEVRPEQMYVALGRFAEISQAYDIDMLTVFARFWGCEKWENACAISGANSREVRGALSLGLLPVCIISKYVVASFFYARVASQAKHIDLRRGSF